MMTMRNKAATNKSMQMLICTVVFLAVFCMLIAFCSPLHSAAYATADVQEQDQTTTGGSVTPPADSDGTSTPTPPNITTPTPPDTTTPTTPGATTPTTTDPTTTPGATTTTDPTTTPGATTTTDPTTTPGATTPTDPTTTPGATTTTDPTTTPGATTPTSTDPDTSTDLDKSTDPDTSTDPDKSTDPDNNPNPTTPAPLTLTRSAQPTTFASTADPGTTPPVAADPDTGEEPDAYAIPAGSAYIREISKEVKYTNSSEKNAITTALEHALTYLKDIESGTGENAGKDRVATIVVEDGVYQGGVDLSSKSTDSALTAVLAQLLGIRDKNTTAETNPPPMTIRIVAHDAFSEG